MPYNISACTVVKNMFNGYPLFEAIASIMHLVDEIVILDMGSTDGTYEALVMLAEECEKISSTQRQFPWRHAAEIADAQTTAVKMCKSDYVLFFQADEVWHENLVDQFSRIMHVGTNMDDLVFWRIQLENNLQDMKWVPHPVHRFGRKEHFVFSGNSMNTLRFREHEVRQEMMPMHSKFRDWPMDYVHEYARDYWENLDPKNIDIYDECIFDISKNGLFLDGIVRKCEEHAVLWSEEPNVNGIPIAQWYEDALNDKKWGQLESSFPIPRIMKFHLGKREYAIRKELHDAIVNGTTQEYIENLP